MKHKKILTSVLIAIGLSIIPAAATIYFTDCKSKEERLEEENSVSVTNESSLEKEVNEKKKITVRRKLTSLEEDEEYPLILPSYQRPKTESDIYVDVLIKCSESLRVEKKFDEKGYVLISEECLPQFKLTESQYYNYKQITLDFANRNYGKILSDLNKLGSIASEDFKERIIDEIVLDYHNFLTKVISDECEGHKPKFIENIAYYMPIILAGNNRVENLSEIERKSKKALDSCRMDYSF